MGWPFAGINRMTQYFVKAERERPDFRLVITYLWHDLYNVDTDGGFIQSSQSHVDSSFRRNRQDESEIVYVNPATNSAMVLRVESEKEHLAARTAYFLAEYMSG